MPTNLWMLNQKVAKLFEVGQYHFNQSVEKLLFPKVVVVPERRIFPRVGLAHHLFNLGYQRADGTILAHEIVYNIRPPLFDDIKKLLYSS